MAASTRGWQAAAATHITEETDKAFVTNVNEHLRTAHLEVDGRYTDEQILSRAQEL